MPLLVQTVQWEGWWEMLTMFGSNLRSLFETYIKCIFLRPISKCPAICWWKGSKLGVVGGFVSSTCGNVISKQKGRTSLSQRLQVYYWWWSKRCSLGLLWRRWEECRAPRVSILDALRPHVKNVIAYWAVNVPISYGTNCSVLWKPEDTELNIIQVACNCFVLHNTAWSDWVLKLKALQ